MKNIYILLFLTITAQAGVIDNFIKIITTTKTTTTVTKGGIIITNKNGIKTVKKPSVKNTGSFTFNAAGIAAMRSRNVKEAFTVSKRKPKNKIQVNTTSVPKAGKKFTETEKAAFKKREKEIYIILKKQKKARKLANKAKPKKAKK